MKKKLPTKRTLLTLGHSVRKYLPNKKEKVASFTSLFQYAEPLEKLLAAVGLVGACIAGGCMPLMIALYGEFTTALIDRNTPNATFHQPFILQWFGGGRGTLDGSEEDLSLAIKEDSDAFGIGMIVTALLDTTFSFVCVACLNYACLRQISRIRRRLVRAVLEKDMAWYDVHSEANFAVNLTEDLNNMQEGMGEKIGLFINRVVSFCICVVMAFVSGWKLTLVVIACVPVIIVSNGLVSKVQATMVVKEQKAYGSASGVAEEAFASIKTVVAFGGQQQEVERYKSKLVNSLKTGVKRAVMSGLGAGLMWFIIYAVYALAFWYGVTLILESRESGDGINTATSIIIVMFGVVAGSMNMGQCLPYLEAFSIARGSATSVFSVIQTETPINPSSKGGKTLPDVKGDIAFKNVHFCYPARPAVQVLQGLDLDLPSGSKVALVGSSGCGKSTCVQLIQRLYDPSRGGVMLDGVDIRGLNIGWLRGQIGVVSQEPMLFATTIYENIRYGMISANQEEIEKAATVANAHDFIMKLPKGYQTMIGQRGTQLSGGQKQRIAIARAVVRDPKILLLDEATSALDASNEAAVQNALDSAAKGRTTLVVAHRLSTVKNADRIVVISDGQFVESGTHDELIQQKGEYFRLLSTQEASLVGDKPVPDENSQKDEYVQFTEDVKSNKGDDEISGMLPLVEEEEELIESETLKPGSLWRILSYSKPEWYAVVIGCLATIVVGSSCPTIAILLGEIYGVLSNEDPEVVRSETDFFSGMILVLGVSVGVAMFLQLYSFGHVASHLTNRLRIMTFAAILRQEPAWFDREENKIGSLSARLSGSAADIQAVAGSSLSIVLQGLTTMLMGLIISFTYSWQMTLVTCCALPILFYGVYYEFSIVQGQNLLEKKTIEGATKVATEAISGIRTVASLGREETFIENYDEALKSGEQVMKRKAFMRGFVYGVGQSATFIGYGISLWYGGYLVADGLIHYKNIVKVSESLLFGIWLLGQSLAFAPGYGKAKLSAGRIFQILDRSCALRDGAATLDKGWQPTGLIEYSKVDFSYPSRPEVTVLRELSLYIKPGTSVALAGASGCGKSTLVQLLQRFYDPDSGTISLDSQNIRDLPMADLRSYMSIVSQEPVLFNSSISENIAYGDNTRPVTQDEIIEAAKTANIHNFIVSLPAGYDTNLGKGGTQLSGGQKQRIAIARALIRNPKILLLDEATSALDTASEAVVQAALDKAATGRTTITVGHRPASIARADVICVLDHGRVVEQGTYDNLISSSGFYASLNQH